MGSLIGSAAVRHACTGTGSPMAAHCKAAANVSLYAQLSEGVKMNACIHMPPDASTIQNHDDTMVRNRLPIAMTHCCSGSCCVLELLLCPLVLALCSRSNTVWIRDRRHICYHTSTSKAGLPQRSVLPSRSLALSNAGCIANSS